MAECVFCRIVADDLPADIVHGDEDVVAIRDINPQAPVHLLVLPRKHITTIAHLPSEDLPLIGHMTAVAAELARRESIAENGYRLVINHGLQGGQTVDHLHAHLLGGRQLGALG